MEKTGAINCQSCGDFDMMFRRQLIIDDARQSSASELVKHASEEMTQKVDVYNCGNCGKDTLVNSA